MLTTRSRSLTAIAAGALLLAALAGCGSDDDKDSSAKSPPSASSSPSTSASPSATASADASADPGDSGPAAAPGERLTKENLVSTMLASMRAQKTAHMVMEVGSSVGIEADVRYSGDTTEMKMSMDMGPTTAEVILVDGVMYLQQAAGGKYFKIDESDPTMGSILEQMTSLGPQSSVAAMNSGLKKLEYAGKDTIGGTEVSKYRVTVETAGMAAALGGAGAVGDLPKTVTYDLYVDEDHLMRRIDMTVQKQHIKMDVTKWGEPVDIEAPQASQITTR